MKTSEAHMAQPVRPSYIHCSVDQPMTLFDCQLTHRARKSSNWCKDFFRVLVLLICRIQFHFSLNLECSDPVWTLWRVWPQALRVLSSTSGRIRLHPADPRNLSENAPRPYLVVLVFGLTATNWSARAIESILCYFYHCVHMSLLVITAYNYVKPYPVLQRAPS